MFTHEFAVIGGGIAGTSTAACLAESASVLLLERESQWGYHSTGRSAALWIASYGPPAIRALTRASQAFLVRPSGAFASLELVRKRGALTIAAAGEEFRLEAFAREHGSDGDRLISIEECRQQVPILRPEAIAGGYHEPGALDLEVATLHQGYLKLARDRGARTLKGTGDLEIIRVGEQWSIRIGTETFRARILINAAGAWADTVAESVGATPLGLSCLKRTALLVDAPPGMDCGAWPVVMDANDQYYFKPDAGKLLLSPADQTPMPPCDAQPDELDIAIAVDRVQGVAELPVRRVNHAWAGLRVFSPDGVPVIGYDPHVAGLFWVAGLGGYGIQTAPAVAALAASLALDKGVPADLSAEGVRAEALNPGRRGQWTT